MSTTLNRVKKTRAARRPTSRASTSVPAAPSAKSGKSTRKKTNRRSAPRSESVMIALDNPNGIRWVLDFAPIYAAALHGIELGLNARGRQMLVCSVRSPEEFQSLVTGRPPDGLLFLASRNVLALKDCIGTIPCVSVLGRPCDGHFDRVTYDNSSTGRLAAELFLRNHLTHAAILGPTEPGRQTTFGVRNAAFHEAMENGGGKVLALLSGDLYEPGNPSNQPRPDEIARLVHTLKEATPRPRGLFVMADNLLPAVYHHLGEAGILPGADLEIVTCNSHSPYFAGLPAEPARVDIPAEEIGRRAVEILEWRSQNPARPTSTTLFPPTLHLPPGCSFVS